jgi:lysozyme family protein
MTRKFASVLATIYEIAYWAAVILVVIPAAIAYHVLRRAAIKRGKPK